MRVLVDITHPAHVHFFRHAITKLQAAGDEVLITSREKDITHTLLYEFELPHVPLGTARKGVGGKMVELIQRSREIHGVMKKFRPHVATAIAGPFITWGCKPGRVPTVVFTDTEYDPFSNKIIYPFATVVATPRPFKRNLGSHQVRYNGYHELAYTHPSLFTPDPSCLALEGLQPGDPFTIVRLVSWQASHDIGQYGVHDLRKIVEALQPYGRVILTSEKELPADLQHLQLRGPRKNMLHLQASARLFFGESPTMAAECAMLGVPGIMLNTVRPGTTHEQHTRYGMIFPFYEPDKDQDQAIKKAIEILSDPEAPENFQVKRQQMLSELINVTDYTVNLLRQYANG